MNSNTNYLGGWVWFLSNFGLQGVLSIKIGGLTQKIQVIFFFFFNTVNIMRAIIIYKLFLHVFLKIRNRWNLQKCKYDKYLSLKLKPMLF